MAQKTISNLSGGVNEKTSSLIIRDTECSKILNYNLDTVGALTKRNGYDVFASQLPQATDTLNGGINATVATIVVNSTAGFEVSFGSTYRIIIESEIIYATGITATDFTGCTRGVEGTTAATHANAVAVSGNKIVMGLFQYTNTATPAETTQVTVANNDASGNSVIYYNNSGTWAASKTNDTAVTTLTNFNRFRFATFLDYIFRVNGVQVVATSININGSSWVTTNAPTVITPSFVAVYEDRVYVARNGAAAASRVYFSALPSAGAITWTTATDFFDVNPDDGDEITALENNGNRLLIFKNRALYRWKFGETEPDRLIGIGTQSQECVKTNFDLGITFFANEYGAYAYTGGRPKLISRKIQKWFDNVPATDVNDFAAEVDEDHYYLYLSDSMTVDSRTYTNVMAVYTISLDAWVIYTLNIPVRFMAKLISSSAEGIYFGSSTGRTYQWNSGVADDSGGTTSAVATPIAGEILTKEFMLSFPEVCDLEYVDVIASQRVNATVSMFLDTKVDPIALGKLTSRVSSFRAGTKSKKIHSVQLRIADNSQNTSIIQGFNFEYIPKTRID